MLSLTSSLHWDRGEGMEQADQVQAIKELRVGPRQPHGQAHSLWRPQWNLQGVWGWAPLSLTLNKALNRRTKHGWVIQARPLVEKNWMWSSGFVICFCLGCYLSVGGTEPVTMLDTLRRAAGPLEAEHVLLSICAPQCFRSEATLWAH